MVIMGGKDLTYEIIYRGNIVEYITPGKWVFIQRQKQYGGGFWFGRVYDDCFWLEFERPVSLAIGLEYIATAGEVEKRAHLFDDDFELY